jgi:UDP-N-acetylmuramoyl-tripeptide--D-alanyl-D-alanine ligase
LRKVALNIEDLFEVPNAVIYNPDDLKPVRKVTIDSREVKKGSLFIAIKGKKFDGHDFVKQAEKKGAAVIMINRRKLKEYDGVDLPIITVKNTTKALGEVAKIWRKKLFAQVIGITGSTGKTSTKDMLADLLNEKYKVNKTESNNNNHIGVPITILHTNEKHDVLLAELGTNHFGEIEYSANILEPDYALITNIGGSHLKYLKNKQGVLKEKTALFDAAKNNDGNIFINYDDPLLKRYAQKFNHSVTYGFESKADVTGKIKNYTTDGRPVVEVDYKNKKLINTLPVYGEQSAKNYLAAVSIALKLGLTKEQVGKGTSRFIATEGRLSPEQYNNFLLIDDTYNASPESMKAAIELMEKIKSYERKVLILGDMFELGKDKVKLHCGLSSTIKYCGIDELYTIGSGMKALGEKLSPKNLVIKNFRTRNSLAIFLKNYNPGNSVILVKGSRGMRMEEFAAILSSKGKK